MIGGWTVRLDPGIANSGVIRRRANLVEIRVLVELDVHQRSAVEVHAQRDAVPEEHR